VAASVLAAMNEVRTAHGLPALRVDGTLRRAAQSHSVDMVRHNYFAHGNLGSRMRAYHVHGPLTGENLAWGTGSAARARVIVDEWMASPPHRANLLRPGFSRVGIGAVIGRFAGYPRAAVVTADFAGR
jgi:uncharacterized protein YkwD